MTDSRPRLVGRHSSERHYSWGGVAGPHTVDGSICAPLEAGDTTRTRRSLLAGVATAAAVGAVLGVLGAGCAACGSAPSVGVPSPFGVSVTLSVLSPDGPEFALLAPVTLPPSIHRVTDFGAAG
ncbi:hypothetical protein BRD02_08005 [Halobacteriales archaeon QS_8_69_73]|nr:MAG: hypothetical protein BRD02_08005 [Halobacteriales archaeon QS_8_69_73]